MIVVNTHTDTYEYLCLHIAFPISTNLHTYSHSNIISTLQVSTRFVFAPSHSRAISVTSIIASIRKIDFSFAAALWHDTPLWRFGLSFSCNCKCLCESQHSTLYANRINRCQFDFSACWLMQRTSLCEWWQAMVFGLGEIVFFSLLKECSDNTHTNICMYVYYISLNDITDMTIWVYFFKRTAVPRESGDIVAKL